MTNTVNTVGLYVRDQDEALEFYVGTLGFEVHTDVRNGSYRWLTVRSPDQDGFQLGLFVPGPLTHDAATAQALQQLVAKGAIPPLVLAVDDCHARYAQWQLSLADRALPRPGWLPAGPVRAGATDP